MSSKKKRQKYTREGSVFYMSGEDRTLASMPRYNAHQGKSGVHGDTKYNRRKEKMDLRRELGDL